MNILPKKRWHVRTKENIARVRRDEAKAAEEEKLIQDRIKLAEREARREVLLHRSRKNNLHNFESLPPAKEKFSDRASSSEHINFFKELEDGTAEQKQSNKEHDKEQKEDKERYEKQIGYLTYLGQDTNEALGKKSWYDIAPDRSDSEKNEINMKSKIREDPLQLIKKYTVLGKCIDNAKKSNKVSVQNQIQNDNGSQKRKREDGHLDRNYEQEKNNLKKLKKRSSYKLKQNSESESSSSEEFPDEAEELEKKRKLEILRLERLKREMTERKRTEELLAKLQGKSRESPKATSFKGKYNSQFNPELAKQNYDRNRW